MDRASTVCFVTLGCDKNLVDSERMCKLLVDRGFELTDDDAHADAVVINTCCFIGDAEEESLNTILRYASMRKRGDLKALIVVGCLAQRHAAEIRDQIPEVDAIVGTGGFEAVADAVAQAMDGLHVTTLPDINAPLPAAARVSVSTREHAYIKIAEGCNKRCSYCVIPSVRGSYRSYPMELIVKEARTVASSGARELILIAQETTVYGIDLYGRKCLHELIKRLAEIPQVHWIRLMYCYPEEIYDELLVTMAREPKCCRYLDIPIQHCDDRILGSMNRAATHDSLIATVKHIRDMVPGVCLRTTLISGYPGETAREHRKLLEFVREMRFDRLGDFTYSREEGTPAAALPHQVPEIVKKRRRSEIMKAQQEIAFKQAQSLIGDTIEVVVEGFLPDENVYIARSYRDAPEVDGQVFVKSSAELLTGDFVTVRLTGAHGYDMIGEVYESAQ